jgi:lyso-ornithine lipid O-acyltransferase
LQNLSASRLLPAPFRRPVATLRPGRRARALLRLAAFAGITLACLTRLVLRSLAPGFTPCIGARHARAWGRWLLRALGVSPDVRGPVPTNPVLLVPNHRSYLDIPVLLASLPCVFLGKAEVAAWPLIGRGARAAGTLFVNRSSPASRLAARDRIFDALVRGLTVVVFPEGTTSAGPGVLPFRPGSLHVAAQLGVPVVPVAISYSHPDDPWVGETTLLGHFLDRFGDPEVRVAVRFGPTLRDADGRRLRDAAEEWIGSTLAKRRTP